MIIYNDTDTSLYEEDDRLYSYEELESSAGDLPYPHLEDIDIEEDDL